MTTESIVLSHPLKVDLSVYRGDSGTFRISVKDDTLSPFDVSGATWDAEIRTKVNDPILLTSFEIEPVFEDSSSVDVILTAENSRLLVPKCVYDIEMTIGDTVTTLIYGVISIIQDVSKP